MWSVLRVNLTKLESLRKENLSEELVLIRLAVSHVNGREVVLIAH